MDELSWDSTPPLQIPRYDWNYDACHPLVNYQRATSIQLPDFKYDKKINYMTNYFLSQNKYYLKKSVANLLNLSLFLWLDDYTINVVETLCNVNDVNGDFKFTKSNAIDYILEYYFNKFKTIDNPIQFNALISCMSSQLYWQFIIDLCIANNIYNIFVTNPIKRTAHLYTLDEITSNNKYTIQFTRIIFLTYKLGYVKVDEYYTNK